MINFSSDLAGKVVVRLVTVEEIAEAALISEKASFITGAAFAIDGGMSL